MLRRPVALAAAAALLAALLLLPGCGSDDPKAKAPAGGPTGEALSYFPAKAGLVALIETDPDGSQIKATDALLKRFPGSESLIAKLKAEIAKTGADFDRDVKPLLGNDLAVGTAASNLNSLLIALVASDRAKLDAFVERQLKAGKLKKTGERAGATLYADGPDTVLAVREATVVIGDTAAIVGAALDRHEKGDGLTTAEFDKPFAGIPDDGLVRISGHAPTLLASPSAASARRVPWVAALGGFAVNLKAEQSAVTLDARIDTSAGKLSEEDLPIAPGSDAPPLAGDGPIQVALRDPAHVIDFVQRAAQSVSPASFAAFAAAKAAIKIRFGVDLDADVIQQLTGTAQLSTDLHEFQLRVGVKDPAVMKVTLAKLAPILPDFLSGAGLPGIEVRAAGGSVYSLSRDGKLVATVGVVGDSLVVVSSGAAALKRFASPDEHPVDGARGALTAKVSGELIAKALGKALGLGELSTTVLDAIDDATGWAEISPAELRAHATLKIG